MMCFYWFENRIEIGTVWKNTGAPVLLCECLPQENLTAIACIQRQTNVIVSHVDRGLINCNVIVGYVVCFWFVFIKECILTHVMY